MYDESSNSGFNQIGIIYDSASNAIKSGKTAIMALNFNLDYPAPINKRIEAGTKYVSPLPVAMSQFSYDKLQQLFSGTESVCVNLPTNADPLNDTTVGNSISADTVIKGLKSIWETLIGSGSIAVGGSTVTLLPDIVFNPSLPTTANPPVS